VKKYLDTECVVVAILPGKGKYTNKMGSLLCSVKDGEMVKLGTLRYKNFSRNISERIIGNIVETTPRANL
jgi:ATP-dependent DNA ligase